MANLIEVEGYTNSDYVGDPYNQTSTIGYIFTYDGGAISWRSESQEYMTLSTIEAEYIVVSEAAAKEAI